VLQGGPLTAPDPSAVLSAVSPKLLRWRLAAVAATTAKRKGKLTEAGGGDAPGAAAAAPAASALLAAVGSPGGHHVPVLGEDMARSMGAWPVSPPPLHLLVLGGTCACEACAPTPARVLWAARWLSSQ
jgi:hypothetical protein